MTNSTDKSATKDIQPAEEDQRRSISKSLVKGLAILACFTAERATLGISELAEELDESRSTTHRYACTLVELGYLEQDSKRRYKLGLRSADIGMSALYSMDLASRARPHLHQLHREISQTVSLAVLDGSRIMVIERLRAHQTGPAEIDLPVGRGSQLPLHCTAEGKLLLALSTPAQQRRLLSEVVLGKHGPNSISSKRALRAQLEQIADTSLAIEDRELSSGLRSIATPIYEESGEVMAAVGVTVSSRFYSTEQMISSFAGPLRKTATQISTPVRPPRPRVRKRPPRQRTQTRSQRR